MSSRIRIQLKNDEAKIRCFKMFTAFKFGTVIHHSSFIKFQLLVFFLLSFVILPFCARDLVFSIYKSSFLTTNVLQNKILKNGKDAFLKAEYYLDSINGNESRKLLDHANIVIAIVTVRRFIASRPLGYLTRVAAAFHRLIEKDTKMLNKVFFICNTYAGPGHHEEANKLQKYFHLIAKFPNGSTEASILNPFEKEKQDYVFCMEQALKLSPKYILMVEDDALPRDELFHVLETKINYLQDIDYNKHEQWSYLKLYFPERWQGYSFEMKQMCELFALFILGTTGLHVCMSNIYREYKMSQKNWRTSFCGGIYFVLIALAVGRQHLLELKRIWPYWYSLVSASECCSPCILYRDESAFQIMQHLKTVVCDNYMPLDIALDRYAPARSQGYLIEPNLIHHIGLVSTLKGLSQHPEEFV